MCKKKGKWEEEMVQGILKINRLNEKEKKMLLKYEICERLSFGEIPKIKCNGFIKLSVFRE